MWMAGMCGSGQSYGCTYDRRARAYCDIRYYEHLPAGQRYFAGQPNKGGFSQLLDFCPVSRAFANGDCTDESQSSSYYTGGERWDHQPRAESRPSFCCVEGAAAAARKLFI